MGMLFKALMEIDTSHIDAELKNVANDIGHEPSDFTDDEKLKKSLETNDDIYDPSDEDTVRKIVKELSKTPHSYLLDYDHDPDSEIAPGHIVKMFPEELDDLRHKIVDQFDQEILNHNLSHDDLDAKRDLLSFIDLVKNLRTEFSKHDDK